jgi:molybdopterin converting factor small subunit
MAKVYLSGGLTRHTGGLEVVEIDAPRVQELIAALTARFPALSGELEHYAVAVDGEIYNDAPYRRLEAGTEVYFVPRVAGGRDGAAASRGGIVRRRPGTTLAAVGLGVAACTLAALAQTQGPWTPPRTPWGHPDLQGVYSNDAETGTPFERPAAFEGRRLEDITPAEMREVNRQRNELFNESVAGPEFAGGLRPPTHLIFDTFQRQNSRAWLVVDPPDGRVPPLTPEARARAGQPRRGVSSNANPVGPFDGPEDLGLYDRCITRGLPNSMMPAGYGSTYDITQSPDAVAIRYEMVHETRIIPLDGRPHLGSSIRQYLGDARGHWEGDTLVVETTNFTDETSYRGSSDRLRMVERFTPIAPDILEWRVTFDDPATWARPWTFAMPLTRQDWSQQLFEYACHEGNYGLKNILTGARSAEP